MCICRTLLNSAFKLLFVSLCFFKSSTCSLSDCISYSMIASLPAASFSRAVILECQNERFCCVAEFDITLIVNKSVIHLLKRDVLFLRFHQHSLHPFDLKFDESKSLNRNKILYLFREHSNTVLVGCVQFRLEFKTADLVT